MDRNDIKWGSIIPLIGGLPLGLGKSLGKMPEFVLSYGAFENNDQHYVNYIRKHGWNGQYIVLDDEGTGKIPNTTKYDESTSIPYADVVCGTPPCAGLSSLSSVSNADSPYNEWMVKAAKFVLENVRPQVYYFENAPRFATDKGRPVLDRAYEVGKANGYNFLVYTTKSLLHGNPQIRARSYGIYIRKDIRGDVLPVFNWFSKKCSYMEFAKPKANNDFMDEQLSKGKPTDNAFYRYICHKYGLNYETDYDKFWDTVPGTSINGNKHGRNDGDAVSNSINVLSAAFNLAGKNWINLAEWMDANGYAKAAEKCRNNQSNVDSGKGLWMHELVIAKDVIPAFVGDLPYNLAHPFEDRFLSFREGLSLMDFPEDFTFVEDKLPRRYANHMCQNVCVSVAKDIADEVARFITGENQNLVDCRCMIQRNQTHAIDVLEGTPKGESQVDVILGKPKPDNVDMVNTSALFE